MALLGSGHAPETTISLPHAASRISASFRAISA